jgi:hypothetical protein
MGLGKRQPSGRERDEAAVELLDELRQKLHSEDISTARKAAFNLSWMQEDGLEILTEALFGSFPRTAKKAAAYGLRSMHGRMQKMGEDVLTKGLSHSNRITKETCAKALMLMKEGPSKKKGGFRGRRGPGRHGVKGVPGKNRNRSRSPRRNRPSPR